MVKSVKEVLSDDFWIMPATPEYKAEGIPYITSKNIKNGVIDFGNVNYISKEDYESISKNRPIKIGDILISMIGTLGETAEVTEHDGKFYGQNMFLVRLNNKAVNKRYFLNFFRSDAVKRALAGSQNQSTQKYLKANHIEDLQIPVPSIEEQSAIANKLDLLSLVITQRKRQLDTLDELIKARFVELFGDPVSDTKNWGQKPLKEMLESIRYGTSTPPEFSDEGYAFIRATNIKNGRIVENDMKYIPQHEADRLEKCKLSGGEIIIVRSGVNAGDSCVVTPEYVGQYAGYDMILVLNESLNPVFLNTLINTTYMEKVVKPMTRRAAQPHLNSEQTQSFPIICVPRDQQDQFATFVEQIDKSKVVVQKALNEAQILFDSLMQQYFG